MWSTHALSRHKGFDSSTPNRTIVKEFGDREVFTVFERPCQHLFWNEKKDRKRGKDNKNTAGSVRWEDGVSASSCENTLRAYFEYPVPLSSAIALHRRLTPAVVWCNVAVNLNKISCMVALLHSVQSFFFFFFYWLYLFMLQHWIIEWVDTLVLVWEAAIPTHASWKQMPLTVIH